MTRFHCPRPSALLFAASLAAACGHRNPERAPQPVASATVSPGASSSVATAPIRRLRRLSSREYDNVVRDLLGDATQPATHFVEDAYPNGFDNGSAGLAVQSDQVVDYQRAAEALAATATASGWALRLGCDPAVAGVDACRDAFLSGLAARAFRRPLSVGERQRLSDVFASALDVGSADTFEGAPLGPRAFGFASGLRAMLEVILQSPQFLYREELGRADATDATVSLTPYEIASELSFLLTGSIPDEPLWSAARDGRLETVDDRMREAARLLETPAARASMRGFLHQWLATNRLSKVGKDAAFYPAFDASMAASMSGELDRYYDAVAWSSAGSLHELFTSSRSFVDPTLATLYGVPGGDSGFAAVDLDPALRQGVMTRAGFLTVHSAADGSAPIERGVFVLDAILCLPPPPPPANIPTPPKANDPAVKDLTTRQRFDAHVASPTCAGCHKRIDGVGFGFEEFDGLGAHRTIENGQPIDASGALIGTGDIDGPYRGVSALSTRIAGSRELRDCYVKQAYRYAMGDAEPIDDNLGWLASDFTNDARMTALWLTLVASPAFATRRFEP